MHTARRTLAFFLTAFVIGTTSAAGCGGAKTPPATPLSVQKSKDRTLQEACADAPKQYVEQWKITGNHPQSQRLRGRMLDDYIYFFGQADGGTIAAKDRANNPLPAGTLMGIKGGRVDTSLRFRTERVDPCIKDAADKEISGSVPLYYISSPDINNLCGALGGEKEDQYPPTLSDVRKCTCEQHAQIQYQAIAVNGYWTDKGAHEDRAPSGERVFTLSCVSAVIAKCVHWGYVPGVWWPSPQQSNVDLTSYHEACVRATRADYAGDGKPATCGGTIINIFDNLRIEVPVDDGAPFEAAWTSTGSTCVTQPRYTSCAPDLSTNCEGRCPSENLNTWSKGVLVCNRSRQNQENTGGKCPAQEPSSCP